MVPLNVWTVLWLGEFRYRTPPAGTPRRAVQDRRYQPHEVIAYERMVRRHLPGCSFRCLSNVEIPGIECVPLRDPTLIGWWAKMELFRPDLPSGRNLYLDLDTVITGDLDPIVAYPAPFAAIAPGQWVGSNRDAPWLDQEGRLRVPRYQTSVMVWDSAYGHRFLAAFGPSHPDRLASDQDFLGEVFPHEARMPSGWFGQLRHFPGRPAAPVKVVLTGPWRNDQAARLYPWVADIWELPEGVQPIRDMRLARGRRPLRRAS